MSSIVSLLLAVAVVAVVATTRSTTVTHSSPHSSEPPVWDGVPGTVDSDGPQSLLDPETSTGQNVTQDQVKQATA